MAGYRYEALDAHGKLKRGVLEVDSPRQARSILRERGLWVCEIDALTQTREGAAQRSKRLWRRGALPASQRSLLMRQFATLLGANLTLEQTLNALIEQAETQNMREILAGVRGEVLAGQSLARAMEKFPRAFPELDRTLVGTGERSGQLADVMARLADYAEQRQALHNKVGLALVYPLIVTVVALAVILVLLTYVVPQVVGVFQHSNQTLPWLTRALIATSEFLRASGWYWLAGIAIGGWLFHSALQRAAFRLRFHAFLLRLPLIGVLIRGTGAARFASTLAILVGSGVPVLAALQAAAGVLSNLPMRRAVEETERRVREGGSLSRSLAGTREFPPLVVHLVASGEASGDLDVMLARAAASQNSELEHRVAVLTGLLEPLLILAMGGMVLLIVLATLLPIIELNQLVR